MVSRSDTIPTFVVGVPHRTLSLHEGYQNNNNNNNNNNGLSKHVDVLSARKQDSTKPAFKPVASVGSKGEGKLQEMW